MTKISTKRPIRGIIPPMITPLLDRETLDRRGLYRLVNYMIDGHVNGIFVLGTTGEAPSLSYRLRRKLISEVCRAVEDRVPVLVGIADTAFTESIELARYAAESGATAVVLTTPYYFPAGQTELISYVRHVVDEVALPVVLYNMPSLTKVWYEIDTLKQLSEIRQIIGIKDSSGDLDYYASLIELRDDCRPDWSVMIGPEHLLAESIRLGGDGGVNGGANVLPRLFTECYDAAISRDQLRVELLHAEIEAFQAIYAVGKYSSRHIKATKSAASLLGICSDFMAEPFHHFKMPEREKVQAILESQFADRIHGSPNFR